MNLEHQHPGSFVFEDSEIIEHKIVTEKPNAYMETSPKPDVDNSSENSLAQNSQKPQKQSTAHRCLRGLFMLPRATIAASSAGE